MTTDMKNKKKSLKRFMLMGFLEALATYFFFVLFWSLTSRTATFGTSLISIQAIIFAVIILIIDLVTAYIKYRKQDAE